MFCGTRLDAQRSGFDACARRLSRMSPTPLAAWRYVARIKNRYGSGPFFSHLLNSRPRILHGKSDDPCSTSGGLVSGGWAPVQAAPRAEKTYVEIGPILLVRNLFYEQSNLVIHQLCFGFVCRSPTS